MLFRMAWSFVLFCGYFGTHNHIFTSSTEDDKHVGAQNEDHKTATGHCNEVTDHIGNGEAAQHLQGASPPIADEVSKEDDNNPSAANPTSPKALISADVGGTKMEVHENGEVHPFIDFTFLEAHPWLRRSSSRGRERNRIREPR
jgi:hypothetical protein